MRVLVQNLAGEQLELFVPGGSTASELKQQIAECRAYPPECISLFAGTLPIPDAKPLAGLVTKHSPSELLIVTAMVTLEELRRRVMEPISKGLRISALQTLSKLAPKDDGDSVNLAGFCLEDPDPEVRREAVRALLQLAERSHEGVVEVALARLENHDPAVRMAAALALPQLARGDRRVGERVGTLLDDADPEVRRIALHVLAQTFKPGDQSLVAMVVSHIRAAGTVRTYGLCDLLWATPEHARELLGLGHAIFVDARDEDAFLVSRVRGAHSMPGHTAEHLRHLEATEAFRIVVQHAPLAVIVYSDTGSETSRCAWVARTLRESHKVQASRIFRLVGGLNQWKQQGFPVEGEHSPMYAGHAMG